MIKSICCLALVCLAAACGDAESPESPALTGAAGPPTCGTYADPALDLFRGCTDETRGLIARYDGDDGPETYRCTDSGFEPVDGRCRFYGLDLFCGCGVDDGRADLP